MKSAKAERVLIDFVDLRDNPLRPLNGEEVKRLAASMERIGLLLNPTQPKVCSVARQRSR